MSAYPGSIDDDATLYVPADSFSPPKTLSTTLAANALSTDTDIQIVASVGTLGAPTAYGILSIADELIIYTGHSEVGSVYKVTGCTRGAFGTAAVGHLAGVIAKWRYVAEFDLALQAAIQAIETTIGITGAFNFLQDAGGNGLVARTAQGVTTARTITAGRGVDVTNGSGASGDPTVARKAAVNAQTGTSYTIADGDGGKLVTGTNGSAQAYTLPQAGASSLFVSGWFCDIENRGAGALTITPTTSTVDGSATLVLTKNQGCRLFSDGTNYFTQRGVGGSVATSRVFAYSLVDVTSTLNDGNVSNPVSLTLAANKFQSDGDTLFLEVNVNPIYAGFQPPYPGFGVSIAGTYFDLGATYAGAMFFNFSSNGYTYFKIRMSRSGSSTMRVWITVGIANPLAGIPVPIYNYVQDFTGLTFSSTIAVTFVTVGTSGMSSGSQITIAEILGYAL